MHETMTREHRRTSAAAYVTAALILTGYLTQTVDCYRLRKTERRKEAEAAKATGVREGEIVFGRVPEKSSNASVEDEASYQADSAGSPGKTQHHEEEEEAAKAAWMRMAPSLHCARDQMKFRAVGSGVSHLAVDQGPADPMPLSQVPPWCGYNMQRNPFGLVMLVPYDGCNMVQQGGNYMLPMLWNGIPVSLSCPKPATTAAPAPQDPLMQQLLQNHYFYPFNPFVTTPAPTTPAPTTPAKPAIDPAWLRWYNYFHSIPRPAPTPADPKSQPKVTHIPIVPYLGQPAIPTKLDMDPAAMFWYPGYPWSGPAPTPADPKSQPKVTHIPIVPYYLGQPAIPTKPAIDPAGMLGFPYFHGFPFPTPTPADPRSQLRVTHIPIVPYGLKQPAAEPVIVPQSAQLLYNPFVSMIPLPPATPKPNTPAPEIPQRFYGPFPFHPAFPILPTTPKPTTKPTPSVPQIPPHLHPHGHGPLTFPYGR